MKQEKSVQICEICGTYSTLRGYLQRPNRSPPRKSVSNRRSKNASNAKNMKKNKRACHRLMTHPRLDFINYIITSKLKSLLKYFLDYFNVTLTVPLAVRTMYKPEAKPRLFKSLCKVAIEVCKLVMRKPLSV